MSEDRELILRIMTQFHFKITREKRGKSVFWIFEQDQGVFKGSTVYSVRHDRLNLLWCIQTLQAEGFGSNDFINYGLRNILQGLLRDGEEQ